MKFRSVTSLIALVAAAPAFAQSNPGQPTVDDKGDTIVVTASRSGDAVSIKNLGASVTVLDSAALADRQTRIVSDILRDVPGVAVSRIGGVGGQTQVRIRGSESNQVLVLIDGIKASDPYYGEYDFGTLIADPDAKIEVLRGQQSALYGSDAIGGVIQYITLTGAEAPGFSARAEGGSFGTFSGGSRVAGVAGDLDYAVSGAYYHTRGTPTARGGNRDVGSDSVGASTKLIWTPTDTFKLTGVARYSYTDADTNNSEFNTASPLFGYTVDSPDTYYKNNAFYGLVRGELSLLDGRWTNALSAQIADTRRKGYSLGFRDYGDRGQRYKASFESTLRFGSDRVAHHITAALDVERERFQNTTPSVFVFQGKRHTDNVGIVGEYGVIVDDALSIGGSIRHDQNDRFADPTTYRVQASYAVVKGTRLHAAYGTGVKNPGYFELYGFSDGKFIGNANLKPERSEGWEAGIEQDIAGNLATIGATWFDSKLKDEIFTSFPAPLFVATPSNRATLSRQHGIEFFANARPTKQVRLDAAFTWLHARENGTVEIRRPKYVASFNTTLLSADQKLSGTLTVRYNGRQQDDAFTDPSFVPVRLSMKSYTLVNLNADYKLRENVALFARVENLFDEDYEEVFSFATPGRAAYAGVRVSF